MSSNPFSGYDENPFADAAVVEAAEFGDSDDTKLVPKKEDKKKDKKKGGARDDEAQLFQGQVSSSSPPAYSEADDATRRKEQELKRKEEELIARQKMLEHQQQEQQQQQQRQQQAAPQQQQAGDGSKAPNWPPFRPWIYHSIPDEIPLDWQKTVRNLYYSWLLTILCLFMNTIGTLCILIAGKNGQDFGLAIMYLVVITPLSFLLWYRPVYNAFMKDSSFYFLTYLLFGGFHILFELYIIVGIKETGSSGFANAIDLFTLDANGKQHIGEGVVAIIALLFWIFACGVHIFLFRAVYLVYRTRGHTIADARNQAFTQAARSEAGRQAISSAATGVVQGMVSGQQA